MDSRIGAFIGVIAALGLSGCGATKDEGTGTPNAQGSGGTGGTSATTPEPAESVSLSDWPWSLSGGQVNAADGVITLSFAESAGHAQLKTHHHVALVDMFNSLHFEATASRPAVLLVAFTGLSASESDYWSDLAAGSPWLAAPVAIDAGSGSYDVPLENLTAQGPGTPRLAFDEMGSMVSFVIDDASSLELVFSTIRLE